MGDLEERRKYSQRMMDLYMYTERQFLEFDEIVPMMTNEHTVNSPKLYFTLLTTCGQIESVMNKIYYILYGYIPKKFNFYEYYKKLNESKVLEQLSVKVMKTESTCTPFSDVSWWHSHNEAKHEMPVGIKQGTISNTVSALAALYLLLDFFNSIPPREPQSILNPIRWFQNRKPIYKPIYPPNVVEDKHSDMFLKNHYFPGPA